jgi:hypothetical protein
LKPAFQLTAKLGSLSHRERLLLLFCAAVVLSLAVFRWGVYPAIDSYRIDKAAVPLRQGILARYRIATQGEGKIDEALADAAQRLEEIEEGMLPGENPAAAGSALQGILKPWLELPNTRLISLRTIAPVQKGPYAEVAVQMDLQTTTDGLAALLAHVPRHPKLLWVKKLSVSSGFYGAAHANRRETLTVSIVIAGMTGGDGETKGGTAEE